MTQRWTRCDSFTGCGQDITRGPDGRWVDEGGVADCYKPETGELIGDHLPDVGVERTKPPLDSLWAALVAASAVRTARDYAASEAAVAAILRTEQDA